MSEIRDKVRRNIGYIMGKNLANPADVSIYIGEILSIPGIAIVDRKAELPEPETANENWYGCYSLGQTRMLKSGWVKEVKDD